MAGGKGKSYRGPHFTIKVFPAALFHSRFGVVVSKKVTGTAVERNKVKRMIFRAASLVIDQWPAANYLIIINAPLKLNQKEVNERFFSQRFR
jgi:ribonuclease P protein component